MKRLTGGHEMNFGFVREIFLVDQFDSCFNNLIRDYQCPSAICGYTSMTFAYMIDDYLFNQVQIIESIDDLNTLVNYLIDNQRFINKLEEPMIYVQSSRFSYITNNHHEFNNENSTDKYMKDWVANYEISDYLNLNPNPRIIFLRNIERKPQTCNHEELRRLQEEVPFLGEDFFLEQYSPTTGRTKLYSPKQWIMEKCDQIEKLVVIADLLGHFAILLPSRFNGDDVGNELILFNTMRSGGHSRPIVDMFYQLYYHHEYRGELIIVDDG